MAHYGATLAGKAVSVKIEKWKHLNNEDGYFEQVWGGI
jgi:hypothetical protein